MKKLLLSLSILLLAVGFLKAQINENFESGSATLNWEALDGTWSGVVNNPKPNAVNSSSKVGRYIKKDSTAYSLFWAKFTTPVNLTTNNRFKINVYSKKAGTLIFKLEGPKGNKEVSKPIVVTNAWQEYNLDFKSASAIDSLNRLILFFDAGVGNSKQDTFWFDNIQQLPADACSGTVANKSIIDDFECQRNANYLDTWDSLTVVTNPDPTGINTSAKVGRYNEPSGAGQEWAALVHQNVTPIDLSVNNFMRLKVWAPKTGNLLMKMENGGAAMEVSVPITAAMTNKWVNVGADFSGAAFRGLTKAVLFFNAGAQSAAGDVYYIDDWMFTEKPALEDFEPSAKMTWTSTTGTYAMVANPTVNATNNSTNVGKFTRGSTAISLVTGALPTGFKVEATAPQMNVQVLAPAGSVGQKVTMQLVSATQGNKTAEATIDSAGTWTNLGFDFSSSVGITDISSVNILFNSGTAASGAVYHFDNLKQTKLTLNVCANVTPNLNILDDFECQRNTTYGSGSDKLTVTNNTQQSTANPSDKIGRYADPADEWSALVLTKTTAIDLSKYNQLSIKIFGPRANTRMLFKLEGGTSAAKEIWDTLRTANAWQTFNIDFSSVKANNYKNIAIFFNGGTANSGNDIYLVDDIQWKSEPISGCAINFESAGLTVPFKYFANDTLDGKFARVLPNPKKVGINTSNTVMEFKRLPNSTTFTGGFFDLPAPMKWNTNITIKAKVLMDHIGNFAAKLEGSPTGPNNVEIAVANTKVNEWEEITVNFTGRVTGKEGYTRLTLFIDLGLAVPTTILTNYIDDIVVGEGSCTTTGIFEATKVEALKVYPNPAFDQLYVNNTEGVRRLEVTNMLGQKVKVVTLSNNDNYTLSLDGLDKGMYLISAFNDKGLVANNKFVKE
ncbi:MAG: T9SS type A sorting domain-containing protein [Saprospiraceae bacterium]|nr:T9SS type A sorting domain-containing protein [Saprospiraceae bacterium]